DVSQAEDGIRDKLVTGVQTCALPISVPRKHGWAGRTGSTMPSRQGRESMAPRRRGFVSSSAHFISRCVCARRKTKSTGNERRRRSEERRVGKECQTRLSR